MNYRLMGSLLILAGTSLRCISAQAASVEVQWQEPEHYRDIRTSDGGQKKFQARVMADLESQFQESARALPEGQTLKITVENFDLAGEMEYFYRNFPFGLRVVRNVDAPSMNLSYTLLDSDGGVLTSGEERVVDLGFKFNTINTLNRSPLFYEKTMIKDWMREKF